MKRFGIFLGFVFVLLIGGAIAAPFVIDVNQYKGQIEQAASEALGRDVDIQGDISLGLLTGVKLDIENLSIANAEEGKGEAFLTLETAQVRLALLPLLSRTINATEVRLINSQIWFEQFADGSNNLPMPVEEPEASGDIGAQDNSETESLPYDLVIDELRIKNSLVTYFDHTNEKAQDIAIHQVTLSLESLSGPFSIDGSISAMGQHIALEAMLGDLAQASTRVRAAINLKDGKDVVLATMLVSGLVSNFEQAPAFAGTVAANSADGAVALNVASVEASQTKLAMTDGVITLAGSKLDIGLEGTLGAQPDLALSVSAGRLDLAALMQAVERVQELATAIAPEDTAQSGAVETPVHGEPSGNPLPQDIRLSFTLGIDALAMNGDAIRQISLEGTLADGQVALDSASAQLPGSGEATLALMSDKRQHALTLDGQLDLSIVDLPRFAAWAALDLPVDAQLGTYQQITARVPFRATADKMTATGLRATLDRSSLTGTIAYDMGMVPAQLSYRLSVDRFDADAYFPPQDETAEIKPATTRPSAENDKNDDDSALPVLAVAGRFDVSSLTYGGTTYRKVMLQTDIVSKEDDVTADIGFQALPYQLAVKAAYQPKAGQARLDRLTFASRKSRVSGTALISGLGEGKRPQFKAALSGPYLDMDDLLPPTTAAQGGSSSSGKRDGATGHARWSDEALPLQPLRLADGTFSLALDQFKGYGLDIVDMNGQASLQRGVLTLDDFSGNLFGGPMQANGRFDASKDQSQMKFDFAFKDADLEKVDLGFWRKGRFSGLVDGTMSFTSGGVSMFDLVKGLAGDIKFEGEKGALRGMDVRRLAAALRNFNKGGAAQVLPALSQGETPFNDLDMWLTFRDGIMTSKQIKTDVGSDVRLASDMMLDLPSWNAKFATGFFLAEKKDLPPIRLLFYGPPDNLKRKLDTEAIQKYYVNSLIQKGVEKLFKF